MSIESVDHTAMRRKIKALPPRAHYRSLPSWVHSTSRVLAQLHGVECHSKVFKFSFSLQQASS